MSREYLPDHAEPYFKTVEQPRPGLDIIDPIEGDQTPVRTGIPVEPTPVEPTGFPYPLDSTVEFCPEQIEWPDSGVLIVRDLDGSLVEKFGMPSERRVTFNGKYIVEATSTLIKNYSRVLSEEFTIRPVDQPGGSGSVIEFPSPQPVRVGVRSHHTQPARAIETTGEPADLMTAPSRGSVTQ